MVPFILTVCVDPVGSDFALNTLHLFNNKEFPIRWSIIHIYMTIEEKIFCCMAFLVIHFSPQVCRHFCHNWLRISRSHILPRQIFIKYLHRRWQVSVVATFTLVATFTSVQPSPRCNLHFCATFTLETFTMEGKWQADQLKLELTAEGEGV